MASKLLTILLVCFVVGCFANGSSEAGTCHSTLSAIQKMLDGPTELPDTCTNCQGRPGKRGGFGPRGPIGPRGVDGRPGACECDRSALEELATRFAELEYSNAKFKAVIMRENHASFPGACYAGISTGKISASDISASSTFNEDPRCALQNVALNSPTSWCAVPLSISGSQWVQVDLRTPKPITGVLTQGRENCCEQWITTYKVSFGNHTDSLAFYQENGRSEVFTGNTEEHATVMNVFSQSITARYFRIHPVTYNGQISMRIELLTC